MKRKGTNRLGGSDRRRSDGDRKSYGRKPFRNSGRDQAYSRDNKWGEGSSGEGEEKRSDDREGGSYQGKKSYGQGRPGQRRSSGFRGKRPFSRSGEQDRSREGEERKFNDRDAEGYEGKKSYGQGRLGDRRDGGNRNSGFRGRKPFGRPGDKKHFGDKKFGNKNFSKNKERSENPELHSDKADSEFIRLNRYIASTGLCSRREADKLIADGLISVNGKVISEMGVKVLYSDDVRYGGDRLSFEKYIYLLLNKPKDFITTADDPQGRRTVLDIVKNACDERIYPVGRLDRNTTGLLLFTNDGDLTKKLTHPKHGVRKIYHVVTNRDVTKADLEQLASGVELEDGVTAADHVSHLGDGKGRNEVGIELHSGKNRIIRRMFEHLGYKVIKLDRVGFAGLTKKRIPRGKWRFLSEKEVGMLKMNS